MATSSSSTTNIDNIPPSLTTISPMPNISSMKLTADNYPLQKAQLVPYFRGQELYGYLDGKIPNPLPFITTIHPDTRELTQIPAYSHWVRHENLILSTLTSSITEGVLSQVISYTTSHVVWQALAVHFFSQSKARIMHIQTQLATIKKGSQPATEYFLSNKKLTDELVVAG